MDRQNPPAGAVCGIGCGCVNGCVLGLVGSEGAL
jgi:hypothetical protein